MYKATDYTSGYGQRKKPSTPILPYLRAKEAEGRAKAKSEKRDRGSEKPLQTSYNEPTGATLAEESYDEARRKIIAGEE